MPRVVPFPCAARLLLAVPLLGSASCGVLPWFGSAADVARWETCDVAEGDAAWDAAQVAVQEGHDGEALPLLLRAIECCPELVRAHLLYQDTARQIGGAALAEMKARYLALPESEDSPVPAYVKARLLGDAWSEQGDSWSQREALLAILRDHDDFYWAWLSLARLLRAQGQHGDAVNAFRRALARNGDLLEAHVELAETLVDLGKNAEAAPHFENYLRGAPADRTVIRAYVSLLVYGLGRADEAMPWIENLLARDPADEGARMDRAAALWRANRPREALAAYLEVLKARPEHARAALNVGFLYYDVLAGNDEVLRAELWPKARAAFLLFLKNVRPEDGHDHLEQLLAVPYRLREIERRLGKYTGPAPTIADLM